MVQRSSALAAVVLAAVASFAALAPGALADLDPTDLAVLNFALNLEYLEANFYSCATYGKPIDMSLWGKGGKAPIGCEKADLSGPIGQLSEEIAQDEIAHVKLLRAVLGDKAVPQPLIDIGPAFAAAADAAASLALNRSVKLSPTFSPYGSDLLWLHGAFIFEDVGATAYAGAAKLIVDKDYLTAAAQILAVESYHAGAIRYALFKMQNKWAPFSNVKLMVRDVVEAISSLRDAVDGPADTDQGVVTMVGKKKYVTNVVPDDANGLIYTRDTNQVLRIVYLGGTSSGGFFPEGLNGAIKTAM